MQQYQDEDQTDLAEKFIFPSFMLLEVRKQRLANKSEQIDKNRTNPGLFLDQFSHFGSSTLTFPLESK